MVCWPSAGLSDAKQAFGLAQAAYNSATAATEGQGTGRYSQVVVLAAQ